MFVKYIIPLLCLIVWVSSLPLTKSYATYDFSSNEDGSLNLTNWVYVPTHDDVN